MRSQYSNSCDICGRSEFPNRSAFRQHIYRCRKKAKSSPKSVRAEPLKIQDTEKITHPYSDEYDCGVCFHRFSSLEAAREHYKTRHIDKVPYETNQKESIQVEKQALNTQDLLNEIAHKRAEELMRSRFAPIVQQQLYSIPEPQVEIKSEPRQESERPQSPVIINALKSLFKGKGKTQVTKEPIPETRNIFMSSRGMGVSGLNISISTQPYFCKTENRYLSWNEYLDCKNLGHEVIYVND
jgi:hypothetical protein